jgi:hypothetical protein
MILNNKKDKNRKFLQFNFLPENRKGGEEVLSVYWFAIVLVFWGGIALMIYFFYGTPYDIRELESRILVNQVADCVSYAGKINSNLIFGGKFFSNQQDFLNNCHLNFNSSDWGDEQFYTEVNFYMLNNPENSIFTLKKGNSNWKTSCVIQSEEKYNALAECNEKKFYSVDEMNNQFIIKILGVVRKSEKNVKL